MTDNTPPDIPPDTAADSAAETERALASRRVARLRTAVRERDARIRMLEERLTALEESTSMALGRAVTAAARRPARGVRRLPRELYRLWRRRKEPVAAGSGARAGGSGESSGRTTAGAGVGADEDRLLVRAPGLVPDRMTVAGIFGPGLAAALSGCANVVSLLPHDAPLVLDQLDPDLMIVDAAAGAAGGPWAYLGEPGLVDRERALLAALDTARTRGCPIVLWTGATPVPPGLARMRWDAVETGGYGVPLHRFNPIGRTGTTAAPLFVDPGLERLPSPVRRPVRALLAALDADRVPADAPELPALLRARRHTVAATPQHALEQLACGARVMCPPQVAARLGAAEEYVRAVTGADAAALAALTGRDEAGETGTAGSGSAGPGAEPVPDGLRAALRALFLSHATPVRLAALVDRLGIDADPLAGRRVAVVATAPDVPRARRLVAELLAQSHPPAELLLPAGTGRHDAFAVAAGELAAHGIAVRPARGPALAEAAATARSPWLAPWPAGEGTGEGTVHAGHLADLVCAAECSGADAVGGPVAAGDAGPSGAAGGDYTYGAEIDPALLRTAPLRAPGGSGGHGARRLTLTP